VVVGRGAEQEEREPARELERREQDQPRASRDRHAGLDLVHELRVLQQRADHEIDGHVEVAVLHGHGLERQERAHLVPGQRAAQGALAEGLDEAAQAFRVGGAGGPAPDHGVAAGGTRQHAPRRLDGQALERLDQVGRRELRRAVVVERLGRVLGQPLARARDRLAEQVAHRVRVLRAGQPAQDARAHVEGRGRRRRRHQPRTRARGCSGGEPDQGGDSHAPRIPRPPARAN
jgi:hypothetical protein